MNQLDRFEEYVRSHAFPMVQHVMEPSDVEVALVALALAGEAGEVANHVKKCLRDSKPYMTEHYFLELGDCLHYLTRLAHGAGLTLNDIADMNMTKLNKRMLEDEAFALKVSNAKGV